ncbi:uncharacterized protein [Argopecten irradians]|uniref:uncharacterized protein n=1 Tax=Argopecten irradians TaxID=31199 RepID=UPI003714F359
MMTEIPDLITVAKNGNLKEVENLLRQNYSVHIRGKDDETALYWSSCRGHVQICKALLDSGSDVNARVSWGSTALHAASDRGHLHCVDLLIKRGANVNIQNKRGDTALHVAAYRGHIDIVRLLVRANPDLLIKNDKGRTAADEAEGNSHKKTSAFLYQHMIPFNRNPFCDQSQALHPSDNLHTLPQRLDQSQLGRQDVTNGQGQWFASLGSISTHNQYQQIGQTRYSLVYQDSDDVSCASFPGASKEKGKASDSNFLRYRDDLTGFRRRTEPEESMDDGDIQNVANKENDRTKLSRRESINGRHKDNGSEVTMRQKGPKIAREGSDRSHSNDITSNILSEFQPCNPPIIFDDNSTDGGLPLLGSCEDVRMPNQCVAASDRPSRISVGCVREVAGNIHNESIENFSESLQMELFKKQELVENLQKENANLKNQLTTMKKQFSCLCQKLKQENSQLKASLEERTRKTDTSIQTTSKSSLSGFINFLDNFSLRGGLYTKSDQMFLILRESLHSHWLKYVPPSQLDVPNKEWLLGKDFTMVSDQQHLKPTIQGHLDGQSTFVFQIKHKGYLRILKMTINASTTETISRGQGYNMDNSSTENIGLEHQLPMTWNEHVNIIKARHTFTGTTSGFQKFLNNIYPKFNIPVDMTFRTRCIVFDHFPESLKSFGVRLRSNSLEPPFGFDMMFVHQLLYQILSAVYYIKKYGVVHRDIKAENVFLDNCLRPVLSNFGMARRIEGANSCMYFTNNIQVFAGNMHAWAPELAKCHHIGPSRNINERVSLEEIYSKSDAYAVSRMFYSLLQPEDSTFPLSSRDRPQYENSEIPELPSLYPAGLRFVLKNQVFSNPLDRLTDRKALLYVGMLMFPPSAGELTMETQTTRYCQARMLKLLSLENTARRTDVHSGPRLTMMESVDRLRPELEADFLHKITPEEFWEIYQDLKQRDFLPP